MRRLSGKRPGAVPVARDLLLPLALAVLLLGCEFAHPEVAVVNRAGEFVMVRNVSFNGCLWSGVLAHGEATSPRRCLPGDGRIHFQRFDAGTYCQKQAGYGTIEGVCLCGDDHDPEDQGCCVDPVLVNEKPNWFNYQTVSVKRVDYGDFHLFEITLDDMEQDFSVPGPYGH